MNTSVLQELLVFLPLQMWMVRWLTIVVVCGIKTIRHPDDEEKPAVDEVISIAGSFATSTGKGLDPKYQRLEDLPASDMKGLRIELHGGTYQKKNQKAIINMQCDPDRTGNENGHIKKGKEDEDEKVRDAEDEDEDKKDDKDKDDSKEGENENSLSFVSYKYEDDDKDVKTLRLDWRTKYACQDYEEDDNEEGNKNGRHWGLFTWFVVLYVLPNIPR